ncbi:MAG: Ig-like domain-containing protein, partial [Defluviitaleaceae bacterium]|nr:Ig-like domain-containing protein [Defluviitaleaceae bacterium]
QDGNPIGDFICGGMDQKPGTADDRTDVVITKDGTKLLGPNPDGSYQAKGPDGKLGTADDTFWWKKPGNESKPIGDLTFTGDETGDFTQTPPVQTTVRNIIIDPASAELFKGDSQQFNATEYMSDGTSSPANNDVTWSVQPSSDATITPDGLLTVKPTATATSITVVAVSKANPAVTQTVTVTVKPDIDATPTVVDGRILTTDLTGDTANWVEIARSGKYSLIIRQDYIQVYSGNNAPDWNYISFGSSGNYIGSNVQSKINAWFNTSSSAPMKLAAGARLRTFTVSNNAAGVLGSGSVTAGLTNGYSKPNTLKSGDGNDIAFALSYGEAANFCSRTYWIRSANPAYQPSDALAAKNLGKLTAHGAGGNMNDGLGIWLRSSGDITGTACVIGYGSNTVGLGDVFQYQLNPYQQGSGYRETAGVYPALWVDSSIFNK